MPPPNAQTGFSHSLPDPQLCEPLSRLACDDKHTPQIDLHHRRSHQALSLLRQITYDRLTAYKQSKLASMLFAFELNRRLETKGISTKAVTVHPGLANTGWADNNLDGFMKLLGKIVSLTIYQSASMATLPILYAATDSKVKPGGYYGPEHDTEGYPVEVRAGDAAYDETDAKRLWELSEKLSGVKYEALNI